MNYVDYCLQIYRTLIDSDSENYSLSSDVKPLSLIDLISKNFSSDQLKEQYCKEVRSLIENKLSLIKIENEYKEELKNLSYYFNSVGRFTMSLVFWMEYNKVKLSIDKLYKISEALLIGSVGYRLLDIHNDDGSLGKESIIIGNFFIHNYEETLLNIFNDAEIFKIISKNVNLYSEVEFLEKRNRWKPCPFSWDEPEKIGLKTAPMYSVFELILRQSGKEEEEIESLFRGILFFSAAIQMLDDFTDIQEDLVNGIETLVMSGFFKKFGSDVEVTKKIIKIFLSEERILRFYNTSQSLFDKAREIFTELEDDILLLSLEVHNYKFNSLLSQGLKKH